MTKTILAVVIASTFLSCDKPEEMQAEILCTPGQSDACACENSLEGAQVCLEDGMSYGECTCEEPAPACTPGEMDACVCDGQELGMRECGEDKAFGECVCESDSGNNEHIPGTQWVLRDKDGKAVPAVFEPACDEDNMGQCSQKIDQNSYPCAFVYYHDGNPVWTLYELSSGKPDNCYTNHEKWEGSGYDNQGCTGIPLFPSEMSKGYKIKVNNVLYHQDTSKPKEEISPWFQIKGDEQKCTEEIDQSPVKVWKSEPVPASIMSLLEAHAPYTINLE